MVTKGRKNAKDWEVHADNAAKFLGISSAEMRREVKRAIVHQVADKIAEQEAAKWSPAQKSEVPPAAWS